MGNQQSAPKGGGDVATKRDKQVSKRVSVQGLSQGKSTVANPSASKASATAHPAGPKHAQKPALQQLQKSQSHEQPTKSSKIEKSESTEKKDVPDRDKGLPIASPSSAEPMDVPAAMSRSRQDDFEESNFSRHYTPVSQMRPPRLPLPIADAQVEPIPESPTLGPVQTRNDDVTNLYDDDNVSPAEDRLRRKDSMLSATTQDDEEVGELQPYAVDTTGAKLVPVPIVWRDGGDKVFVTGTFATWQRKFKLHRR
jgi:Glycogen recognition site of AMP-activated protein kinase